MEGEHRGRRPLWSGSAPAIECAWKAPSRPRTYFANAGCPFADVSTTIRRPSPGVTFALSRRSTSSRPSNQVGIGGISHRVSWVSRPSRATRSAFSKALAYRSSRARRTGSSGSLNWSSAGASLASSARALWSELLTAAVVVSSRVGHLGRLPGKHVPQNQHGALPRRQVLQGGDHRQSEALPSPHDQGRVGAQHQVGERLQPGGLQVALLQVVRVAPGAPSADGHQPAAAVLQGVQADPGRDPVEPGPDRRALLEVREPPPGPQIRLLYGVLRVVQRAEHPVAVRDQLTPVPRELVLQVHPNSSTAPAGQPRTRRTGAVWRSRVLRVLRATTVRRRRPGPG